jgi:hypothetical protein
VDRRVAGTGRRAGDPKAESTQAGTTSASTPPASPPAQAEQRPEIEPDRRHWLHKKVGGKKKAA